MPASTDKKPVQTLPGDLAAVALIDGATCAAAGAMSLSWWHEEVRAGRAPAPVIKQSRCTRWRVSDVAAYWANRAAQPAGADPQQITARAAKASAAARAKRQAQPLQNLAG